MRGDRVNHESVRAANIRPSLAAGYCHMDELRAVILYATRIVGCASVRWNGGRGEGRRSPAGRLTDPNRRAARLAAGPGHLDARSGRGSAQVIGGPARFARDPGEFQAGQQ
jgi:hypothetical protein